MNKLFFTLLLLLFGFKLLAQLEVRPVPIYYDKFQTYANARTASVITELDTISLPFWDDFSFSEPGVDSTLWQNGIGVFINPAIGINQPTINVATFDGINSVGRPYNSESDFVAPTDSLLTHAIDLSSISLDKQPTVYLSFFWQMQGLGELPDETDSLRLEFLNRNGEWIKQWSITGLEENISEDFQQVYMPISGSQYFHSGFRFKFQSYGKTTGAFDSWHLDYIYLNQDRNTNNESIFDHAIATEPVSLFNTYTTIPYSQLFAFPDTIFAPVKIILKSFENNIQPVEYNYIVTDEWASTDIYVENSTINPLTNFGRGTIETAPIDKSLFNPNTDSLYISTEFQFISGDKYFIKSINNGGADTTFLVDDFFNFRLNDTIRQEFLIHDVLAYDDGSAEFSAGINQSNGQLAIQYILAEQDSITDIDIYFPLIKPVIPEGTQMNLSVFNAVLKNDTLSDINLLAKQSFTITPADSIESLIAINKFFRYTFENPVVVSDTFYIGFQQFTDDYIAIGLDKTTNQGDKIFVNTQGDWERNIKVEGSLMMRPIFGKTNYDPNAVVGIEENQNNKINIFPNPASDLIHIKGDFDRIELMSISGQLMNFRVHNSAINVSKIPNGIYILKATIRDQVQTQKVIIRH